MWLRKLTLKKSFYPLCGFAQGNSACKANGLMGEVAQGTLQISRIYTGDAFHSSLAEVYTHKKKSNVIVKAYSAFKFLASFCWRSYLGRWIRLEWELSDLLKWSSRMCGVSSKHLLSKSLKCMHAHDFYLPNFGLVWSFLMIAHCVI